MRVVFPDFPKVCVQKSALILQSVAERSIQTGMCKKNISGELQKRDGCDNARECNQDRHPAVMK
jgi:hypothetical protein